MNLAKTRSEETHSPSPRAELESDPVRPAAPTAAGSRTAVPAFTIQHLSVYFGGNQVLKKLSLDIQARAVTAIIGPSGCGKSTFLRSLNRMHELIPGPGWKGKSASSVR